MITREDAIDSLHVFVVFAATRIRDIPTEVELGDEDSMPRDCVLNADPANTVAKGYLVEGIYGAHRGSDGTLSRRSPPDEIEV